MNSKIESRLKDVLREIAKAEGLDDAEARFDGGKEKGDGYMSHMLRVDLLGKQKRLPLIAKCAPEDIAKDSYKMMRKIFGVEMHFYEEIYETLLTFQRSKICGVFQSVPRCFGTVDDETVKILILENLKEAGYSMWDRKKDMDDVHVEAILREYGKFHATSLALKDQKLETFRRITKDKSKMFQPSDVDDDLVGLMVVMAEQILGIYDAQKDAKCYEGMCRLKEWAKDTFRDILANAGEQQVILHGDCWSNNMMFKYENLSDPKRPTSIRLYDFQACKLGSPVIDVSNFFYPGATKHRLDNCVHFQKVYYESFSEHLENLGSDPEKLYPFATFQKEWRLYAKFGLLVAPIALKAMYREEDEVHDMTDSNDNEKAIFDGFKKDIRNPIVETKLRDLAQHFVEENLV